MTRKRTTGKSEKATSQRDLARQLQVSRSTIDRLRQDGLTCDRNGEYDLEEARQFQRVRVLRMRDAATDGEKRREGALQLKESRLRVDLELAEFKLAVMRGEYVSRQTVSIEWRRGVLNCKNALLGLGRQLAPLVHGRGMAEIKTLIDGKIFEVLRHLASRDHCPSESAETDQGTDESLTVNGGRA